MTLPIRGFIKIKFVGVFPNSGFPGNFTENVSREKKICPFWGNSWSFTFPNQFPGQTRSGNGSSRKTIQKIIWGLKEGEGRVRVLADEELIYEPLALIGAIITIRRRLDSKKKVSRSGCCVSWKGIKTGIFLQPLQRLLLTPVLPASPVSSLLLIPFF